MTPRLLVVGMCLACACAPRASEVVVFAAASLTEAVTAAAEVYEHGHPEVEVVLSFAGSSLLAAQLAAGAPADVFAPADNAHMAAVRDEMATEPRAFATNGLVIVVSPDAPFAMSSPGDLASPGVRVVLGAPEVPVGAYARSHLATLGIAARVEANVVSNETDVKEVLAKVRLGEAHAGIVYRTDVTSARSADLATIPLPGAPEPVYPVAVTMTGGPEASSFVDFLLSRRGQQILEAHGFGTP